MAELTTKVLDWLMYWESGNKDYKGGEYTSMNAWKGLNKDNMGKGRTPGTGFRVDFIDWNTTGSKIQANETSTKVGITLATAKSIGIVDEKATETRLTYDIWLKTLRKYYWDASGAQTCTHMPCAVRLCESKWVGFDTVYVKKLCDALYDLVKNDPKSNQIKSSSVGDYIKIAQYINLYSHKWKAYEMICTSHCKYLWGLSNASSNGKAWGRRLVWGYHKDGLYINPGVPTDVQNTYDWFTQNSSKYMDPSKNIYQKLVWKWDDSPGSGVATSGGGCDAYSGSGTGMTYSNQPHQSVENARNKITTDGTQNIMSSSPYILKSTSNNINGDIVGGHLNQR